MVFNSLTFAVFFAVVIGIYRLPIGWTARKLHLLVASYAFYAAWNPPFVLLLVVSTAVDFWAGRRLGSGGAIHRKLFVVVSLLVNLGLLSYFKYADFAMESLGALLGTLGVAYQPPDLGLVLPVGISFRIMDKFLDERDRIEIGSFLPQDFAVVDQEILVISTPSRLREFISNQAKISLNFDIGEKLSGYLDYTNYYLDYDDPIDDWLDRMDNLLSLTGYYHHSPKTSLFIEFTNSVTEYDTATWNDNKDLFL